MTSSEAQFCPNCELYQEFLRENRTEEYDVRGQKVTIEFPFCVCKVCQEAWIDKSYGDPVAAIFAKHREQQS